MTAFSGLIATKSTEVLRVYQENHRTLATAESCTGGLLAAALTAIAGSSAVVECGFVTYSNRSKSALLGVSPELLQTQGAVNEEVARAMVEGALSRSGADAAVAITGIAGPGGGSAKRPVGLIHFAASLRGGVCRHERCIFAGDRFAVREQSVIFALDLLLEMGCNAPFSFTA